MCAQTVSPSQFSVLVILLDSVALKGTQPLLRNEVNFPCYSYLIWTIALTQFLILLLWNMFVKVRRWNVFYLSLLDWVWTLAFRHRGRVAPFIVLPIGAKVVNVKIKAGWKWLWSSRSSKACGHNGRRQGLFFILLWASTSVTLLCTITNT